jgi:signal transduction histidine kinase
VAGGSIRLDLDGTERELVRISVSNAGDIPASELPTLFDPFRRAAAASKVRRSKGLGLGLYIVQQIVHAHGGRIEVRSHADGTCFVVELPRVLPTRPGGEGHARAEHIGSPHIGDAVASVRNAHGTSQASSDVE